MTSAIAAGDNPPAYEASDDQSQHSQSPHHGQPAQNPSAVNDRSEGRRPSMIESPPVYTPFDECPKTLRIAGPIIYTINDEGTTRPRYHIKQQTARSGKIWKLQIRRLLSTEARRLSTGSPNQLEFDQDTILYEAENTAAMDSFARMRIQIRGRKAGTLRGHLELHHAGRSKLEIKQCTRPASRDPLREENMKKMHKWGYKAEDEWEKTVLFSCHRGPRDTCYEWKQRDEVNDTISDVASETQETLALKKLLSTRQREALLIAWVSRKWTAGELQLDLNRDESWPPEFAQVRGF